MTNGEYIYMLVSTDEHELPLATFDTAKELADYAGVKESTVLHAIWKVETGRTKKSKYVRTKVSAEKETKPVKAKIIEERKEEVRCVLPPKDVLPEVHEEEDPEPANDGDQLFHQYFQDWVDLYKDGAVRNVTLKKYKASLHWVKTLMPNVRMSQIDRKSYQKMINKYAETHELQTVKDFNTHVKACITDAIDDGLIQKDPTKKVILKGKSQGEKKIKYLNQFQLHQLLEDLELGDKPSWDWLILLVAKTGLRFSEALGLTPKDFDFANQVLSVNKTWDYKEGGGFAPTKNKSSVRKIRMDWQLVSQFGNLLRGLPENEPIFVPEGKDIYNSTINGILERHCLKLGIPVIAVHGLRHTHASILLYAGASIASVARRLGHSNMTTTQKTYLHIIQELENQDVDVMMRAMSAI